MYIKKLELFGFKSFAEKVVVEMGEGVTAVVGPNGSGKSNISDALLWVLGEANVRNIRGQKAIDVIFNGSEKRKALGMAEVSLTLDNSCGTLPIQYNEVTITRRAYRSGEAEYLINKTRCRLKDIYELFLDTGIGREAYSFVTQGEIDAILSAKSEDRRELFEEAAGVKKYRYRRQEAIRKLEKTEGNLQRVRDIMNEISGQLEPLEEQAEQAKRYNELTIRLREIEIGLLIRDLRKYSEQLQEARDLKKNSDGAIERCDEQIVELEVEKEKQAERLRAMEEEVDGARRVQSSLSANVQRLESKAALLEERLRSAQSEKTRADEDISGLQRKIDETRERIAKLESEQAGCLESETAAKSDAEAKSRELADLDARFDFISKAVSDEKATYIELAKELAAKRNALQNSRERVDQLTVSITKLDAQIDTLRSQKSESETISNTAKGEVESLQESIQNLAVEISELTEKRKILEAEQSDLGKRGADISREIAGRSSRLSTLREMAESHEGFFDGVRSVMAARNAGKLQGEFDVVADVISVPKGYEIAIEIALGANLQDVITDSSNSAKAAIAFLKQHQAGRATFLPLDNMRPSNHEVRGNMDKRSGALGIAAELIGYDKKYDPALWSLLGRTVVVDGIDNAIALSRQLDGWNKIVTLDGEIIIPSGAITGGTRKNKGSGLLVRKQEIDMLTQEIAGLERKAKDIQSKLELTETQLAESRSRLSETEKTLSEQRMSIADSKRRIDFASNESSRIDRQLGSITLERDEAGLLRSEESASITDLEEQLQGIGSKNTDLDAKVADAEQGIEALDRQRTELREELMKLNVALAGSVERTLAIRNSLAESKRSLAELTSSLDLRTNQIDGLFMDTTAVESERDNVKSECERQRELLTAAEKSFLQLVEKRSDIMKESEAMDIRLRQATHARNKLAEDIHDADVREARLEVQLNQCSERLMQEYELSFEQAMEWPDEIEIERGTASEVARLRREIKDMGVVNVGAIGEYERIKERWDFLTEQRADLDDARDQINAAIREIDTNTRGLFMDTFNTVAANFEVMFKRLFGGGRTELTLTDPNNLLDTGIDITIQPPGKKLQDMSLLSGGERALTACALLFALLLAKPSPFVVMDEVDAPLDESNVERFAETLREFGMNSQFIVVTHNRATMEAATNLYGVTMQEPGVSKLISVKLSAEQSAESTEADEELIPVEA